MKGGIKLMNKKLGILLVSLMMFSFVLGAQGNLGQGAIQTQNQGEDNQLEIQVQAGEYMNQAGEQMQIRADNGKSLKIMSGEVEAKTSMNMTQSQVQNKTKLHVKLSNGINAEIKIMPDTASETALARLSAKCNGNCTIELKESGNGNQTKAVYEVQAQKEARILGIVKTKMQVQAQIDAETGEVVQTKKPWWAFLASE